MSSRAYPHTLSLFTDENPVAEHRNGVCIYALYHINKCYCFLLDILSNPLFAKIIEYNI